MSRPAARALLSLVLGVSLAAAACGDTTPADGLTVVATTTILGDVVTNVAGADATVEVILPVGADPHDYQPSARQVAALLDADLVIANGLGLEAGFEDVLETVASDGANVVEIAPMLDPIPFGDSDGADGEAETRDPHVWLDPLRMTDAARIIAAELETIDGDIDWASRADAYAAELLEAHDDILRILEPIPAADRLLVTNHDALGYFAARYGFEVIGTVIPGGATLSDPSSGELAALVAEIEERNVPAIFAETTEVATLAEAVAAETGGEVAVVELFTGSLGEPGEGADTLVSMLVVNATRIADALR
jgi:zinc/manganese transport system substrate-binding protein